MLSTSDLYDRNVLQKIKKNKIVIPGQIEI